MAVGRLSTTTSSGARARRTEIPMTTLTYDAPSVASAPSAALPHPPRVGLDLLRFLVSDRPVEHLVGLWRRYRGDYALETPHGRVTVACSHALVAEVLDERGWEKKVGPPLLEVRRFGGDGLFTAFTDEPSWHLAHGILTPAFRRAALRVYFDGMLDVSGQLVEAWERVGEGAEVDVAADMTRLTLETIGLCGFGVRFGSFSGSATHPFLVALARTLTTARRRINRLPVLTPLMVRENRQFDRDVATMNATVDDVVRDRRRSGELGDDLLGLMLAGQDKVSGERLSDVNIRYQALTFLIAGHETTSGLLSFALYFLLKHPEVMARVRAEVDAVLGDRTPRYEDMEALALVKQVLQESLRLWPTASVFERTPKQDAMLGGRLVRRGEAVLVLLPALHRDPVVWGPNAEAFDPDRFSAEAERARPATAFKPFGHGKRACIGRHFAMLEATLALAVVIQRFDLSMDAGYALDVAETLTLKPEGLKVRVRRRREVHGEGVGASAVGEPVKAEAGCPFHRAD